MFVMEATESGSSLVPRFPVSTPAPSCYESRLTHFVIVLAQSPPTLLSVERDLSESLPYPLSLAGEFATKRTWALWSPALHILKFNHYLCLGVTKSQKWKLRAW